MGVQHRVARFHLKGFMSRKPGEGRLFVYSNRQIEPIGLRPIGQIACYEKNHSDAIEKQMGAIEDEAAPILRSLDRGERRLDRDHLVPVIDYMALLAIRNLGIERHWEKQIQAYQIAYPHFWDDFEEYRQASRRRGVLMEKTRPWLTDVMKQYPNWETVTPLGENEEYIVTDTPALVSVPMDGVNVPATGAVIMPVSKKTLLIGYGSRASIQGLDFCAWSVNSLLVAYSQEELYSHRKLNPEHIARWITVAPFVRLACRGTGPQAFLRVECAIPLRPGPK